MKSAFLTAIFGITAAGAILLAVPAEEKAAVVKTSPAKWAQEYGAPVGTSNRGGGSSSWTFGALFSRPVED